MVNHQEHKFKWHGSRILLIFLFAIFAAYSFFMAFNLQESIIPDEPAHFTFSKAYSRTFGIPPDTYDTYSWGWYIKGNPFLYYWINGRIINLTTLFDPNITDHELLVVLRVVSVIYALGTIWFCFLLSKEIIHHRWWQLLPVFLLTNTLMFVFLSAGVQYDNLANLFSISALYFFVRVLNHKNFINNSIAWMISISLGTLVKYPILPLALAIGIAWLIFIIVERKNIFPIRKLPIRSLLFILILSLTIIGNAAIYGVNLIKYQSITPPCREILLDSQCELSLFEKRQNEIALDQKLTITESISQGYPSPLRYAFVDWVYHMLMRSVGLIGHVSYFPLQLIPYYQILFYFLIILGIMNMFLWQSFSSIEFNLLGITLFYVLILFITNYNSELTYGFKQIALQGRYLFPILGAIVVLVTKIIKEAPIRLVQYVSLAFTIGLTFYGGPLTFLIKYNTILFDWFK